MPNATTAAQPRRTNAATPRPRKASRRPLAPTAPRKQQKAPMIEPTRPMFARITGVRTAECQAGFGVSDAVHAGGSGHAPATITSRSESASTPAVTHRNRTVARGMGGVAAGVTGSLDIQALSAASRSPLRPEAYELHLKREGAARLSRPPRPTPSAGPVRVGSFSLPANAQSVAPMQRRVVASARKW